MRKDKIMIEFKDAALDILKRIYKIRLADETIASKYHEGKMRCPTHLSTGQEAVPAVIGALLNRDDFAVSSHRAHGHYIGKGGDIKKMIAEIYGKISGCSRGKGGSMHLVDLNVNFMGSTAIVGGTIPIGVGLGLSIRLKNTGQISCVFFGDGSIEEGVFYESINFAVLKKLPVLFVCENNLYSVYSPLSVRQPAGRKIYKMVEGMGCESRDGDGNNPVELFGLIKSAIEYIRNGKGPYFLELYTYRWREHCGPNFDNDIGYRTEQEFETWKKKDPMVNFENYIIKNSIADEDHINKIKEGIQVEIDEAFDFAERSSFPEKEELYKNIYAEM